MSQQQGDHHDPMAIEGGRIKLGIGEALEATAHAVGDKPVEKSDAAAIEAAGMRATGRSEISGGGIGGRRRWLITPSVREREEDKVKMRDIVTGVAERLPADKEVTREDAVEVVGAELRNSPNVSTTHGGVAASVATAARLNENTTN